MRVVFSRKGFDSEAGGVPSPIVDGRPISLPIPTVMPTPVTYGDLRGQPFAALVTDLTRLKKKPSTASSPCHLDPDLDSTALARTSEWRGAFGQTDEAQSHLAGQGIAAGDLFLFFGLFRPVVMSKGAWKFAGAAEHRVFGWLQIDTVLSPGANGSSVLENRPWLRDHPHARDGWTPRNTIYVAKERLDIAGCDVDLPGWGLFARGRTLTAPNATPSVWLAPVWLHPLQGGVGMTYHENTDRWLSGGRVQTVARGQEFVAHVEPCNVVEWLAKLFEDGYA